MAYTIINESNYKEILDKLIKLTDHKVFMHNYGVYEHSTVRSVLAGKGALKIKRPCFWVQNNGKTFRGSFCSSIMTNATYLDIKEHWLRKEYLEGSKKHSFMDWKRQKPYIYVSINCYDRFTLYEGDAIEFTENDFKVLVDENDVSDFVRYYDFKHVMDVNDFEFNCLKASKDAYDAEMEEIEARLDAMDAQDCYEDLYGCGACLSEPYDTVELN